MELARKDAAAFLAMLPDGIVSPSAGDGDDEVVVEWHAHDGWVVVSFEGDGTFGYAYRVGRGFVPGAEDGVLDGRPLPADLIERLPWPADK